MERGRDIDEDDVPRLPVSAEKREARYLRPDHETIEAIAHPKDAASSSQDFPIQGDAAEVEQLTAAFKELETSDQGKSIAAAIRENRATVEFATLKQDTVAEFHPPDCHDCV